MCFGEYLLYKGNGVYNINSCETIEVFYNVRTDLDKLIVVSNLIKIIKEVTTENQNTYKILQFLLNTLYIIAETDKDLRLIEAIFNLKILTLSGFMPNIEYCSTCRGKENLNYFSFRDSGFKCKTCVKNDTGAIKMDESTKMAIKYIITSPAKKIYNFNVSELVMKELQIISKIYLNEKLK